MLERVEAFIREHDLIEPGGEVCCLVSGGADSTCLWHVLGALGYRVSALHVNHKLRGEDSDEDARFCSDVLGAEVVELDRGRYAYRIGGRQLNVHGPGATPQPRARTPVAPGNSDLCFEWPGPIEAAVEHLRRRDVEVEVGPDERSGARGRGRSVYFRDPDGSLLELISYR